MKIIEFQSFDLCRHLSVMNADIFLISFPSDSDRFKVSVLKYHLNACVDASLYLFHYNITNVTKNNRFLRVKSEVLPSLIQSWPIIGTNDRAVVCSNRALIFCARSNYIIIAMLNGAFLEQTELYYERPLTRAYIPPIS